MGAGGCAGTGFLRRAHGTMRYGGQPKGWTTCESLGYVVHALACVSVGWAGRVGLCWGQPSSVALM